MIHVFHTTGPESKSESAILNLELGPNLSGDVLTATETCYAHSYVITAMKSSEGSCAVRALKTRPPCEACPYYATPPPSTSSRVW
jgi:hypothetical protein